MKYEKALAEVVKFDEYAEFLMVSIAGLGKCESVEGPLTQDEVTARAGDGHGACGGFAYVSSRTYYDCDGYARSGYNCPSNHCDVVDESYCHIVWKG